MYIFICGGTKKGFFAKLGDGVGAATLGRSSEFWASLRLWASLTYQANGIGLYKSGGKWANARQSWISSYWQWD